MNEGCEKCGYKSLKNKKRFGKNLCEFCFYFAPIEKEKFLVYINEIVNSSDIQTYRKQGILGGIRQYKGMEKKAREGFIMSRPPFGYEIKNKKLIPAKNSHLVLEIYETFLNNNISLNQLRKRYALSVNGLKKVLTNFTYIGKIKFDSDVHEGNHKALISSILFNHVQDKLDKLGIKR